MKSLWGPLVCGSILGLIVYGKSFKSSYEINVCPRPCPVPKCVSRRGRGGRSLGGGGGGGARCAGPWGAGEGPVRVTCLRALPVSVCPPLQRHSAQGVRVLWRAWGGPADGPPGHIVCRDEGGGGAWHTRPFRGGGGHCTGPSGGDLPLLGGGRGRRRIGTGPLHRGPDPTSVCHSAALGRPVKPRRYIPMLSLAFGGGRPKR